MATINGTFNSLIGGTISGTVGTPGPAGPAGPTGSQGIPGVGVPVGGTAGQVLAKVDGVNYNTEWIDQSAPDFISSVSAPLAVTSGNLTVNLAGYATETFVTSQGYITSAALVPYLLSSTAAATYYPLTNPSGFITSSALSPYLLSSTAAATYQTLAGMAGYAQLSGATFTGNVFAPTPSPGTDSTRIATTEWVKDFDYAQTNSPQFTGNPRSVTPSLSDDDTSIATTAFVKGQNYLTSSALSGYALLSGATFSGKVNFTSVSGASGLNVGIGGTAASSPTAGDLWIATSGSILNYRDGAAVHRLVAVQNLTNTFSSPQIIDTTNSTPALRVTQKGTGDAIRVEDDTTPDATRFTVDQFGKVGIGVAPDATAALKVDTNGIMFGDGTVQTTATLQGPQGIQGEQGIPGDPGAQGTSLDVRGAWEGTTSYSEGDIVIYGGFAYVASFPNYNDVPPGSAWTVLTETVPGPQGPQGPPGEIPEAPVDGNHYVRKDGAWVQCTVVSIFDSNTYTSYNCLTV
jgi:hypothetical protein